jgi:MerR family mercuric resistance operon transcriptional regulator
MPGEGATHAIGAASKQTGCHIETIRYYERIGLLPAPNRSVSGYRRYGLEHLKRLMFVRRARDLGFTLEEVRRLLRLADRRERSCAQVRDLATGHLRDVQAKIRDLRAMERVLTGMIGQCADGTLPDCPLIEALFRAPTATPRPSPASKSQIPATGLRERRPRASRGTLRAPRERVG